MAERSRRALEERIGRRVVQVDVQGVREDELDLAQRNRQRAERERECALTWNLSLCCFALSVFALVTSALRQCALLEISNVQRKERVCFGFCI